MSPGKTGLLVSSVFHLGLLLALFFNLAFDSPRPAGVEELPLTIQMFAAQPETKPVLLAEPETEPERQPEAVEPLPEIAEVIPQRKDIVPEEVAVKEIPKHDDSSQDRPEQKPHQPEQIAETEAVLAVPDTDTTYIRLLEQQYADALKKAIEARKFYPARARRRAREGDVVVAFTVSSGGDINNIRVVHSSSVRSLDKAAVNAVNSVGRFEPFPSEIIRDQWEFEIALSYHLL